MEYTYRRMILDDSRVQAAFTRAIQNAAPAKLMALYALRVPSIKNTPEVTAMADGMAALLVGVLAMQGIRMPGAPPQEDAPRVKENLSQFMETCLEDPAWPFPTPNDVAKALGDGTFQAPVLAAVNAYYDTLAGALFSTPQAILGMNESEKPL